MANVKIINHSPEILGALHSQVQNGLERVGMQAETYAKQKTPVNTGALRNSITHAVKGDTCYIGTNQRYGIYVEMGTGIYATSGGRRTAWVYKDEMGDWHTTKGQKAQPFLKPAAADHADDYRRIIESALKGIAK